MLFVTKFVKMATDIKNTNEDADMAECEGEKVVTMMDVLKEQEDFEEDANAVLGGSDDKNCTYSKGYIKRQAIYACLTCCADAKTDPDKRAGVCLACSLMCHENHELIELYTKRNFKCDCGNPKFNSHPCTFTPNKTELNEDNNYNQNFSGVYCICKRPYPDPEATEEDVMIQCIICEDWLHSSHLESSVPANDQYSEMVCKQCMDKNDFLHDYSEFAVNTECNIEIVQVNGNDGHNVICNGDTNKGELTNSTNEKEHVEVEVTETGQHATPTSDGNDARKADEKNDMNKEEDVKQDAAVNENTADNDKLQDSSLNKNSGTIEALSEDKLETNPKETISKQQTDANELEMATSSEASQEKINEENIKKSDTDSAKTDDKVDDESKPEISQTSEGQKNKSEEISKDEKLPNMDNSDEEKEKKDQDAEKMEEDKLLADPVEEPESKSSILSDKDTANSDTITKEEKSSETNECSETSETASVETEANTDKSVEKSSTKEKPLEKRKLSIDESTDDLNTKKPKIDTQNNSCSRPQSVKKVYKGATFWPSSFRQKLCTCQECISMYRELSVLFLTDPEDTVTAYENLGKEIINGKPLTQYEKGLQALSSLDRIQQINALTEYNNMRDKLLDFLKNFKDRKEIVKEEDIKAFFAGMKPKREPDGVYFCR